MRQAKVSIDDLIDEKLDKASLRSKVSFCNKKKYEMDHLLSILPLRTAPTPYVQGPMGVIIASSFHIRVLCVRIRLWQTQTTDNN